MSDPAACSNPTETGSGLIRTLCKLLVGRSSLQGDAGVFLVLKASAWLPVTVANHYDFRNVTVIVDGAGAGVMSVSFTVLPSELRTNVFSRPTLPLLL